MGSERNASAIGPNGAASDKNASPAAPSRELVEQTQPFRGTGTVYTYSLMYNVPQGFEEQKPYVIAIVQLDEGPMVTAQLTDINHDTVAIGMRVEMVTRKLREEGSEGQIVYGYKFRPLLQDSIGR